MKYSLGTTGESTFIYDDESRAVQVVMTGKEYPFYEDASLGYKLRSLFTEKYICSYDVVYDYKDMLKYKVKISYAREIDRWRLVFFCDGVFGNFMKESHPDIDFTIVNSIEDFVIFFNIPPQMVQYICQLHGKHDFDGIMGALDDNFGKYSHNLFSNKYTVSGLIFREWF